MILSLSSVFITAIVIVIVLLMLLSFYPVVILQNFELTIENYSKFKNRRQNLPLVCSKIEQLIILSFSSKMNFLNVNQVL